MISKSSTARFTLLPLVAAMALPGSVQLVSAQQYSALEEVVVTARRKDESLQDVPESVSAVTGDKIEALSLLSFEDITSVVPGVNLEAKTDGYSTVASMRGASFDANTSASPTVQMYVNEAPVHASQMFIGLYDVGQLEVLKGPQGTVRGVSSPSGSITLNTRAPDLHALGGFVNLTQTNKDGSNYQAALNLPIIEGRLAARIAGVVANDQANYVKSINSTVNPDSDLDSHRISLRWMPTDDLDIQFMRQKTDRDRRAFTPVAGDGTDLTAVTGINGPRISPKDRLAVGEFPSDMTNDLLINTLNVNWQVMNHEIHYVGSRSEVAISGLEPRDLGNVFPGEVYTSHNSIKNNVETHELRFSSAEPYAEVLDYSVGLYRSKTWGGNDIVYYGSQPINTSYLERQDAAFASLTFYLGAATEFTVGARHIQAEKRSMYDLGVVVDNQDEESVNVYKLALSHQFTDNLLAYVNWGTSWRMGPNIVGLRSTDVTNPQYKAMTDLDSEESRGWELGIKADFHEGRGRINAAVFSQDYENYFYRGKPIDFLTYLGAVDQHAFTTNADASVKGVEIDAAYQITPNWNLSASASWYDSELKSAVPCITGETDPAQFRADGVIAYFCSVDGSITFDPDWTASVQS